MTKIPELPPNIRRDDTFGVIRHKLPKLPQNIQRIYTDDAVVQERAFATLMLPGNTSLKIEGAAEVVKQILGHLDGLELTYNNKERY
jgi:hypothetical protein